jgi:arylsulfatase A-like enzyme
MTMTMDRRTRIAALALWALGACGGGAAGPAYVPLELALDEPGRALVWAFEERAVRPADEPQRFTFEAGRHRFADGTESAVAGTDGALLLWGQDVVRAKCAGPFDPRTFNTVHLSAFVWSPAVFTVQLVRGGAVLAEGRRLRAAGGQELVEATFDFPGLERETGAVDELQVVFAEQRGRLSVGVVELRLERRPPRDWLPGLLPRGVSVEIGDDARPAVGLASGFDLVAELPEGGAAWLCFDFGVPPELAGRGDPAQLVLEQRRADGARTRLGAWPVEPGAGWRTVRLALGAREAPTELVFGLSGPDADMVVAALGNVALRAPGARPRTVLLVTSDTHRADHLGCAEGGARIETPFLDALSRRGVRFSDCYSATNVTNPSHGSLLVGLHPRDTGIVDNATPLSGRAETLAERFRDAGFLTFAALSSPHLRDEQSGLGQGFERVGSLAERDRDGAETVAQVEGWLADAQGLSLFVWVHLYDAHAPYAPPAPFDRRYWPDVLDPYDAKLPLPPSHRLPAWDRDVRELDFLAAQYRAEVSYVDHLLARLVGHARFADALVCVTADHGESLGEHEIWFDHQGLFPATLAIPLILAGPGVQAGPARADAVQLPDLGRTLLDLAGLEAARFPGKNLLARAPDAPRFALASHGHSASVRSGAWFLVLNLVEHRENRFLPPLAAHQVRLYDLSVDPHCSVDVAELEVARAAALRGALVRWLAAAPAQRLRGDLATVVDAAAAEQLARLGYAPGVGAGAGAWFEPDECEWCARFAE